MTVIELFGVLNRFGVDVLVLAFGVTFLTSLLKKTVMKSVNRKVFVFLPFGLGILIYTVYSILSQGGLCFTAKEILTLFGRGISTGCAATLYYVFYEQFLRGKLKLDPLTPMLECVPEEKRSEASDALLSACRGAGEKDLAEVIGETLKEFADPIPSEEEFLLTVELLKEYISTIT